MYELYVKNKIPLPKNKNHNFTQVNKAHIKDEPFIPKIPQTRQQKSQILMQVLNTTFLFKQQGNKE
jgi:hypothetical protein